MSKKHVKKIKYRFYTLLEMLMAITIFMFLIASVSAVMHSLLKNYEVMTNNAKERRFFTTIDQIADMGFRNAINFHWIDPQSRKNKLIFDGENNELLFCYRHRISDIDAESGLRFLRIHKIDNKLVADYRNTVIIPDSNDESKIIREVIGEQVKEVSFKYANMKNGFLEWREDWRSDYHATIPLAIQMEIEYEDGRKDVFLRRTTGAHEILRQMGR